jgi:hypothetical protein
MFVELTPELVAAIVGAFCERRDIVPKRKDFKKVFNTIVEADDVDKFYFCEVTCAGSGQPCMRQVVDEDSCCHFHDPAFKCKGAKMDGNSCGSIAKNGADFCWRHEHQDMEEKTKKTRKNKHKRHSRSERLSEDETVAYKKDKKNKTYEAEDKIAVDKKSIKQKRCKNSRHKKSKKRHEVDDEKKAYKKSKKDKTPVNMEEEQWSTADDNANDLPDHHRVYFPLRDAE